MATDTIEKVVDAETRPTETTDGVVAAEPRPIETTDEVMTTEPQPTETNDEVVSTPPRPRDENDEVVKVETHSTKDEIAETGTQPTDTAEVEQTERRPDLIWDAEARGLCLRVHGDGSKSFIFVYRTDDRQRFLRIGKTPIWSLESARERAKELRAVVDQGGDPISYNRERGSVGPVENVIRYIAEHLRSES
jgi:cell division septation protein DedD